MMTDAEARDWMRKRLLASLNEESPEPTQPSFSEMREEYRADFEHFMGLMLNRIIMGRMRYGGGKNWEDEKRNKLQYPYAENILKRAQKYLDTGNREWLVDAANFAFLEFILDPLNRGHWEDIHDHDIRQQLITHAPEHPAEEASSPEEYPDELYNLSLPGPDGDPGASLHERGGPTPDALRLHPAPQEP